MRLRACFILLCLLAGNAWAGDDLFDPARHMRIDEVRPGMKGYGLSVFFGTKIERFDVEVVSILRSFNPKGDVILIRCSGANLEHTGPIAGMSGSPIYLTDDQGRARMVGAFAYGWPLMKDPLAGVQPIEYMLAIDAAPQDEGQGAHSQQAADAGARLAGPRRWVMPETYWTGWSRPADQHPLLEGLGLTSPPADRDLDNPQKLQPLGTPLTMSGVPTAVERRFSPLLRSRGLITLQAGGAGGGEGNDDSVKLEPGSVIAVPLMTGDVDLTAVGTVTEVIGDRVYGFGHPFNGEGPVELPMAGGSVNGIIASLMTSFKLGAMGPVRGTLTNDQTFGIAGMLGDAPATVPIDIRVVYTNGSEDRAYHFDAVSHPQFTPLLSAMALMTAVTGQRNLPPHHTLDYDLTIAFANGQELRLQNTVPDTFSDAFFFQVGMPMMTAANNPFEKVMVQHVRGEVRVMPQSRAAEILSVILPKSRYRPGEKLRAFVLHRPFRGPEAILPIEIDLPRDLNDGEYQLSVSDWQQYLNEEQTSKPFRFVAESVDEVFEVLRDVMGVQKKALYVRLMREADGVAIGRTAMPHLPSSRRQVILSGGRSNTTPFVSSTVKTIPTDYIMSGAASFAITIERDAKIDGANRPPRSEPAQQQPARPAEPRQPRATPEAPAETPADADEQN